MQRVVGFIDERLWVGIKSVLGSRCQFQRERERERDRDEPLQCHRDLRWLRSHTTCLGRCPSLPLGGGRAVRRRRRERERESERERVVS